MGDNRQMGRRAPNPSRSVPPPPPPPPPPTSSLPSNGPSKSTSSLAAELSSVSLKQRPSDGNRTITQSRSVSNVTSGPFRLPQASTLKKVRPPMPPSSSHPPTPSSRSADLSGRTQGGNSASNLHGDPSGSYRLPASTLPKKLRPPLPPPPPPPSVPPSGFSNNNSSKFVPPPPPSQAISNNVRKPDLPPKKSHNPSNRPPLTSMTNLESRFRHVFKDLHTLPAPEPFLSTKKQYPSERRPRGPAPPIPSRASSVSSMNQNGFNNPNIFNSMPMLHVQLEHQAMGFNYPRH